MLSIALSFMDDLQRRRSIPAQGARSAAIKYPARRREGPTSAQSSCCWLWKTELSGTQPFHAANLHQVQPTDLRPVSLMRTVQVSGRTVQWEDWRERIPQHWSTEKLVAQYGRRAAASWTNGVRMLVIRRSRAAVSANRGGKKVKMARTILASVADRTSISLDCQHCSQ